MNFENGGESSQLNLYELRFVGRCMVSLFMSGRKVPADVGVIRSDSGLCILQGVRLYYKTQ